MLYNLYDIFEAIFLLFIEFYDLLQIMIDDSKISFTITMH